MFIDTLTIHTRYRELKHVQATCMWAKIDVSYFYLMLEKCSLELLVLMKTMGGLNIVSFFYDI